MNNTAINKIKTLHTNRLLVSTVVSLALLAILLFVHRGQSYSQTILQTQASLMALCIISAVSAVVMAVVAIVKKKTFLIEYIVLAVIMVFCFYCLHGVGFVTIKVMKYITAVILVAYMVVSLVYHTIASKMVK